MAIVTLIAAFCSAIVALVLYFLHANTSSSIFQALQESSRSENQREQYVRDSKSNDGQKQYHMVFSTSRSEERRVGKEC